jgi:hypothetical protein
MGRKKLPPGEKKTAAESSHDRREKMKEEWGEQAFLRDEATRKRDSNAAVRERESNAEHERKCELQRVRAQRCRDKKKGIVRAPAAVGVNPDPAAEAVPAGHATDPAAGHATDPAAEAVPARHATDPAAEDVPARHATDPAAEDVPARHAMDPAAGHATPESRRTPQRLRVIYK